MCFLPKPLNDYLTALDGLVVGVSGAEKNIQVTMATNDSRKVENGGLFVAISGALRDGVEFVSDALSRGAAVIVSERALGLPGSVCNIVVGNAYHAAGRVAEVMFDRPADKLKLIGITGTNGKTTCAFMLHRILCRSGVRTGLIGTIFYDTGVRSRAAERTTPTPFELQEILLEMVEAGCEYAVIETSSHALDQRRLGSAWFDGALFTNLSGDHCDYHITMDAYFQAKSVLFHEYLKPGGAAVVNVDDGYGRVLARGLAASRTDVLVRTLGHGAGMDYAIVESAADLNGCALSLNGMNGRCLRLRSGVTGDFNIMNLATSAALALELGVDATAVQTGVVDFCGAPGRLQRFDSDKGFRVFVDYAHTDDALSNVLKTLRGLRPHKLLVVFGCGGDRDASKRPRMAAVAAKWADQVIVTSDNPRSEAAEGIIDQIVVGFPPGFKDWRRVVERRLAIANALASSGEGDVVLIAGKGHEDYQEINGEKIHFDDREEVSRLLRCDDD